MEFGPLDHTFAVCAYKESPYLRECIESLKRQTITTNIIMTTSTDNPLIRELAEEFQIPLYVNRGPSGIAYDWNFAYHHSKTRLVTLAHQDDTYHSRYVESMLSSVNHARHPLIYFTDYHELRNGQDISSNQLLRIKRLMLAPLRIKPLCKSRFVRRRILSMGNPVSCPSVTYIKEHLPATIFIPGFQSNIDWQAWELLSRQKGEFVYEKQALTWHRIHPGSETSAAINHGNVRAKEDFEMFLKFWPEWMARILMRFYVKGEASNNVG